MKTSTLAVLTLCLFTAACGGSDSPTNPTPNPTPTLVLTATGDWPAAFVDSTTASGQGNALGVAAAPGVSGNDGKDAGAAWIAIKASGSSIGQVRGTLLFDPGILSFDVYSQADWFKQGGALVSYTLLVNTPGQIGFQIDRPSTLQGAVGSGAVVYIRMRGVAKGTSQLQWQNPELRGPDSSARPLTGGSFGGRIAIN